MRLLTLLIFALSISIISQANLAFSQTEEKLPPPFVEETASESYKDILEEAHPSKKEAKSPQEDKKIDNPYIFATDEQIIESQKFYRLCTENDSMNSKKDCKCAASSYLETRLKLGNTATIKEIMAENVNTCLINKKESEIEKPERYKIDATKSQIEEAETVYDDCKVNQRLNLMVDCECLASEFLDTRVKKGPIPSRNLITSQITRYKCKNIVETTGIEYQRCMRGTGFKYGKIRAKDYCECYARTWANGFERYHGKITADSKASLRFRARMSCTKPEAYKNN